MNTGGLWRAIVCAVLVVSARNTVAAYELYGQTENFYLLMVYDVPADEMERRVLAGLGKLPGIRSEPKEATMGEMRQSPKGLKREVTSGRWIPDASELLKDSLPSEVVRANGTIEYWYVEITVGSSRANPRRSYVLFSRAWHYVAPATWFGSMRIRIPSWIHTKAHLDLWWPLKADKDFLDRLGSGSLLDYSGGDDAPGLLAFLNR